MVILDLEPVMNGNITLMLSESLVCQGKILYTATGLTSESLKRPHILKGTLPGLTLIHHDAKVLSVNHKRVESPGHPGVSINCFEFSIGNHKVNIGERLLHIVCNKA